MMVTRTVSVSVPVTKTVTSMGADGKVTTSTVTETVTETKTVEVEVPDPPKPVIHNQMANQEIQQEREQQIEQAAQKKAEQEIQAQQQQAAAQQLAQLHNSQPKDGLFGGIQKLVSGAQQDLLKTQVKPITAADARNQLASIQSGMQSAKTPQDVQNLATQASVLEGRIVASNLKPDLQQQAQTLQEQTQKANEAVNKIEFIKGQMNGTPEQAAGMTASLLNHPESLTNSLGDLGALKGSPVLGQIQNDVNGIASKATPDTITQALNSDPNLSNYPAGFARNLGAFAQVNDPALHSAIQNVARGLVAQGVSMQQVQANPGLGQVLSSLQDSSNPADQQALHGLVQGWGKQAMLEDLKGKEKESGVKDAAKEYTAQMVALAKQTGLGPTLQSAAQDALSEKDVKNAMNDTANKGKSFWDSVGDFFSGAIGDIGKGLGSALSFVGNATGEVLHLAGQGLKLGLDAEGKISSFAIHTAGALAADGLNAVGAHGLATDVKNGADTVANVTEKVYDAAGQGVADFGDGAGAAMKGMGSGLGFIVAHPLETGKALVAMAEHPSLIVAAGKAMWNQATENGHASGAYTAGYIAGNLVPMLLSGGAAGGAEAGADAGAVAGDIAAEGAEATGEVAGKAALEGAGETAAEGAGESLLAKGVNFAKNAVEDSISKKIDNFTNNINRIAHAITHPVEAGKDVAGSVAERAGNVRDLAGKALDINTYRDAAGSVADVARSGGKIVDKALNITEKDVQEFVAKVKDLGGGAWDKLKEGNLKGAAKDLHTKELQIWGQRAFHAANGNFDKVAMSVIRGAEGGLSSVEKTLMKEAEKYVQQVDQQAQQMSLV